VIKIKKPGKPHISVIVPVRNESRYIAPCLKSLLANDYPVEEVEILVIDGLSDDGTRKLAESFQDQGPLLRVIDNPDRIVPAALNRGLREAHGEIIIRVDGHAEVAPDFIRKNVETLQAVPEAGCVGGRIESRGTSLMGQVIPLAQGSLFGGGGGIWFRSRKAGFVDTVPYGAYRSVVFEKVGFFDETLVRDQDEEFNYRLREAGYKIYLNPEIRSIYHARESLLKFAKQYFQYGFWKVKVFRKRTKMMQARQFVPPFFVAALFFLAAASTMWDSARLALGCLVVTYLLFSLLASLAIGKRKGWRFVLTLPLAFGVMHLGYGLGFWSGVFYFTLIRVTRDS